MVKTSFEKALEKQMRQAKLLADKQNREARRIAAQEARLQQASTIVNGQPIIKNLRIMDKTSEDFLKILLQLKPIDIFRINFTIDKFPSVIQNSLPLQLEKLKQYGIVGEYFLFIGGGEVYLLSTALTYFDDKEKALKEHNENNKETHQNITNYGNLVIGNVVNSSLNIDNSIHEIEKMIDEQGSEDREILYQLLEEVKELLENIEASRNIPKQKSLMQRLSDHLEKHSWFYGAVTQLIGSKIIGLLGK